MQERIYPNLGGERVTKKKPRRDALTELLGKLPGRSSGPEPEPEPEPEAPDRRALIVGGLGAAAWLPRLLPLAFAPPAEESDQAKQQRYLEEERVRLEEAALATSPGAAGARERGGQFGGTLFEEGDAVTSPAVEVALLGLVSDTGGAERLSPKQRARAAAYVQQLESRGGSQYFAASGPGKWVIPWVGGWQKLWSSSDDAALMGGPSAKEIGLSPDLRSRLSPGGASFQLASTRYYVYGPGDDGVFVEYLYRAPGAVDDLLLTRAGRVRNDGGNRFGFEFGLPLRPYEARVNADTTSGDEIFAALVSGRPLEGLPASAAGLPGGSKVELQTTYLSERVWIIRDANGQTAAFERTETRSVADRRGLVADGQLKPPDDDSIRFGRLLFGETLSDYNGWESDQKKDSELKDKLFK